MMIATVYFASRADRRFLCAVTASSWGREQLHRWSFCCQQSNPACFTVGCLKGEHNCHQRTPGESHARKEPCSQPWDRRELSSPQTLALLADYAKGHWQVGRCWLGKAGYHGGHGRKCKSRRPGSSSSLCCCRTYASLPSLAGNYAFLGALGSKTT